ncbi:hypothetical protein [Flavobacterium alkalisoli]|uniref:hypothetical protein n=1 Tax=Flavobacterium alkalisoli TaxID=2602769 RepID=UPI003A9301C6
MRNQEIKIDNHSFSKLIVLCFAVFLLAGVNKAFAQFAIMEDFRGNGNPSIIIGGPGGGGGMAYLTSGINDPVNQGWLRLTNSSAYQRGYAYVDNSFPSSSGVLVDFEYKMWRDVNDGYSGADGLTVFLFDASSTFAMGGYGGSLGYAPNGGSGLAGGYVGVGLDAYGNFSNPTEGRNGGPGVVPNAVVLRGPTTTNTATTNAYLDGAALGDRTGGDDAIRARNEIDYNTQTSTRPTDAQFYRRVQLEILPLDQAGVYYQIIVRWKKSSAANFTQLISYTTTTPPPALLKLGFGASSGGGVNYHEIRNLLVTTPGNVRVDKRADKDILRSVSGLGSENVITYTIDVVNDTDIAALNVSFLDEVTDGNGNLIAEGNPGFNITSITSSGFSSITLPTAASLTTNQITGTFNLAANTTGKIFVTGTLTSIPAGNVLNNTATITPPFDEDLSNNISTVSTPVYAEGVDLVLARTTVNDLCINPSSPSGKTFELRVANIGQSPATYRRRGSTGERIVVTKVVQNTYGYNDSATDFTTDNNNTTARWHKRTQADTPTAGYTTYTYLARYPTDNSDQILGPGSIYQTDYPIIYTITPPVGTTSFTDSAQVEYRAEVNNNSYGGSELQTTVNQANDVNSVTLNAAPTTPTVTSPVYYCQGETATALSASTTNASYQLQWYVVNGGFASDYPFVPSTTTPGTTTYYVSQKNATCESNKVPIQVIVYASPTAGAIGSDQTICNGATPAQLTSTTAGTAPSGGTLTYRWEWSLNGTSGWTTVPSATGVNYQPPALTATRYYRRVTVVTNGSKSCEAATSNVVITVMAATNPGAIGSNQTICSGSIPASLTSTTAGSGTGTITYRWESSPNNSTWTAIASTNNLTYQPPALTSTTYYRRVTIATLGSTVCEAATSSLQMTVNAVPTAGAIGSNQTICYNTAPALLTSTTNGTGTGTVTYRWESSPNNTSWTTISGATSSTYQPGNLTANTYFRRTTLAASGATCTSSPTSSVLITVNSAVTAGTISTDRTICNGATPAQLTGTAGSGTGTITYRWESSPNNSTWTTVSGATGVNYQPGALTATTYYRRITIATSGTACESSATNVVTITVNSAVTAGTISANQTICNGATPAQLTGTAGTGTGTITYRWESSPNNSTWTTVSGATGANYQPGALTATTYYRRITIATSGVACESSATNVVTITVNNAVTAGSISANQTICNGATPAQLTGTAGTGTGTITYRWESSPNNSTWTTVSGATGVNYQPGALTATTYYRRITIATSGTACESSATNVVTITVNSAVTAGSISANQTICNGATPAQLTGTAGTGTGTIAYSWESSPDNSTWTTVSGATGVNYQPGALTATTYYRRITTATSGVACQAVSNVITITVNAVPTAGSISANQTICNGATPAQLTGTTGTGTGTITYRWESSPNNSTWTTVSGATGVNYQPGALTATTYYRRITIATSGTACESSATNVVTITVNSAVTAGSISANQTICNGATPAQLTGTAGTGTGTITYRWESSPNNSTWTTVSGATGVNYQPGALTATTYYRRITIATSGVACESSATNVVTITVNNAVTAGSISANQTICNGATPAQLTGTAGTGTGTITYRWESSPNNSTWTTVSGATGVNYQPGALTATTYYRRITIATSGVACESSVTNVVTITVNAVPTAGTIGSNQTICNGDTPAMLTGTAVLGTGTITYRWESSANGTSGWTATGGTGNNYQPGALTATTYYRRITIITSGGATCESAPTNLVTITVNAVVTEGSIGSGQTICHGAIPALLTSTTAGTGTGTVTYRWESSPNGSSWTTVSGATGATYQPAALYETTYYRRITIATSGVSCESPASNTVTVTIKNCNLITNPMIYQRVSN